MHTPVIWRENERPSCSRNPPNSSASSSAVRSPIVAIRQWCERSVPWNSPSTVCVFPTSMASSTSGSFPAGILHGLGAGPGQEHVVDQPGRAERSGDERPSGSLQQVHVLPRRIVDQGHVVEGGERFAADPPSHAGSEHV